MSVCCCHRIALQQVSALMHNDALLGDMQTVTAADCYVSTVLQNDLCILAKLSISSIGFCCSQNTITFEFERF
jgi:hypothetical protein